MLRIRPLVQRFIRPGGGFRLYSGEKEHREMVEKREMEYRENIEKDAMRQSKYNRQFELCEKMHSGTATIVGITAAVLYANAGVMAVVTSPFIYISFYQGYLNHKVRQMNKKHTAGEN